MKLPAPAVKHLFLQATPSKLRQLGSSCLLHIFVQDLPAQHRVCGKGCSSPILVFASGGSQQHAVRSRTQQAPAESHLSNTRYGSNTCSLQSSQCSLFQQHSPACMTSTTSICNTVSMLLVPLTVFLSWHYGHTVVVVEMTIDRLQLSFTLLKLCCQCVFTCHSETAQAQPVCSHFTCSSVCVTACCVTRPCRVQN